MALSRVKTWISGEVLTASDLNSEFNNLINNGLSLISPLTGNLAANSNKITGLGAATTAGDALRYEQLFTTGAVALLGAMNWVKGADVASASALNLTTATGNAVHVTGTTTITSVTLGSGMWRLVVFDGILTLTHHATNNNLPGSTDITTAAGDRALYWADGTTVYCALYQRANGIPIGGASLSTNTFTGTQTIESTDAGAGAGPDLVLYRNSASPAASDLIGRVVLNGEDSAGNTETYGVMQGEIVDPTSTSEDSQLSWWTVIAGTLARRFRVGAGFFMEGATGGDLGANTINASQFYNDGVALPEGIAAQSDMETATNVTLAVTPGRMQYHPGVAKAWAQFDTAGGLTVGYNVSSITDSGTGFGAVNFTTSFSSANYSALFNVIDNAGATSVCTVMNRGADAPKTSSSATFRCMNYNWTAGQDPTVGYTFCAFGDQ